MFTVRSPTERRLQLRATGFAPIPFEQIGLYRDEFLRRFDQELACDALVIARFPEARA